MKRVYERLKGKELEYSAYSGILCGFSEDQLILATLQKPDCSFRKLDKKKVFIEEEFKDSSYRFCWCDERDFPEVLKYESKNT